MKRSAIVALVIITFLLVFLVLPAISYYNSFVDRDQAVKSQWAQVENQYQRRFDLIPNLVEATKGIMKQEREVFGKLAEARTKYAGAKTPEDKVTAANEVETALSKLLLIVENYPNLRSSESVQLLMVQLEGTENRISIERRRYNEKAQDFNTVIKRFPGNLFARIFGFEGKDYFKSVATAEKPPEVDLK